MSSVIGAAGAAIMEPGLIVSAEIYHLKGPLKSH